MQTRSQQHRAKLSSRGLNYAIAYMRVSACARKKQFSYDEKDFNYLARMARELPRVRNFIFYFALAPSLSLSLCPPFVLSLSRPPSRSECSFVFNRTFVAEEQKERLQCNSFLRGARALGHSLGLYMRYSWGLILFQESGKVNIRADVIDNCGAIEGNE